MDQEQIILIVVSSIVTFLIIGIIIFVFNFTNKTQPPKTNQPWSSCTSSNQCDKSKGYYCRVGDKRCLTDGECSWANWKDQTSRDCSRMTT